MNSHPITIARFLIQGIPLLEYNYFPKLIFLFLYTIISHDHLLVSKEFNFITIGAYAENKKYKLSILMGKNLKWIRLILEYVIY